mmetsp:Transcript_22201/g.59911  ORF Transcript_22201/g.59911 Transcript_22201/m.59911 type:complete len:260 (-) Transcript_22201:987-1766(-)
MGGRATLLLGLLEERLELGRVHHEALLLGHELREVHGEAERGVERVHVLARHGGALGELGRAAGELLDALVQRARELLLLLAQHLHHALGLGPQLGEGVRHEVHECGHELVEEAGWSLEDLRTVAHGAPEDAAEHVAAALVGGERPVGDGEGEGADVVGHHAVGHVHEVRVLGAHLARVGAQLVSAHHSADGVKELLEHVDVVVGALAEEHGGHALEAHARVHAGRGELLEAAVALAVELHEDEVPDLEHVRVVLVDQM